MPTHTTLGSLFSDIADAIREKSGSESTIVADNFPDAIEELQVAGPLWNGEKEYKPYLLFTSKQPFKLQWNKEQKTWDGTIQYNTAPPEYGEPLWNWWNTWHPGSTINKISSTWDSYTNAYQIFVRGFDNTIITGADASSPGWATEKNRLVITSDVENTTVDCIGSITALLDCSSVNTTPPTIQDYCFAYLFYLCPLLNQIPNLPLMNLSTGCYYCMFGYSGVNNSYIRLPAKTVPNYAYFDMFSGSNITSIVDLPATYVGSYGYQGMFALSKVQTAGKFAVPTYLGTSAMYNMYASSSLINGPTDIYIPETVGPEVCYNMFYACYHLLRGANINFINSAYNIPDDGFHGMYYNCRALIDPGAIIMDVIPSYVIGKYGCYQMYYGCELLTSPLDISHAWYIHQAGCAGMYIECVKLNKLPKINATVYDTGAMNSMFSDCTLIAVYDEYPSTHTYRWSLPYSGRDPQYVQSAVSYMFQNTSGNITTPQFKYYYYTDNQLVGDDDY